MECGGLTRLWCLMAVKMKILLRNHWVDGRASWNIASRSEAVMVAAGFNPRMTITHTVRRRVATHGALEKTPAFERRAATVATDSTPNRGLKPTATFISSLRDEGWVRLMESPLSFSRMHWDHEPQAVPRRTKSAYKSGALQTLRARGRVGGRRDSVWSACVFSAAFPRQAAIRWPWRFMESPLSLFRMHWDHEPVWAIQSAAGPAHSKTWRKCARLSPTR